MTWAEHRDSRYRFRLIHIYPISKVAVGACNNHTVFLASNSLQNVINRERKLKEKVSIIKLFCYCQNGHFLVVLEKEILLSVH